MSAALTIHNCHTHIFTIDHVPERFLPLGLVRWLAKGRHSKWFARQLNDLNPFSNRDVFTRYASFVSQGANKSQEDVLRALMDYYPGNTRFVILTMDMDHMCAGRARKDFISQLDEIAGLLPEYGERILPFVFAHPERRDLAGLVKKYVEQGFRGIKIYPPLGYFPTDPGLEPVWEYALENRLPVMTHCSRGGVYTREKKKHLPRKHPLTGEALEWKNRKQYTDQFTDPDNFEQLLARYPDLKICFGHFGGKDEISLFQDSVEREVWENSWFTRIKRLMEKYPNTYADVSYSLADLSIAPLVNITMLSEKYRDRILFGSDFYMAHIEGNEYRFSVYVRNALGEVHFRQMAEVNPLQYLKTGIH